MKIPIKKNNILETIEFNNCQGNVCPPTVDNDFCPNNIQQSCIHIALLSLSSNFPKRLFLLKIKLSLIQVFDFKKFIYLYENHILALSTKIFRFS